MRHRPAALVLAVLAALPACESLPWKRAPRKPREPASAEPVASEPVVPEPVPAEAPAPSAEPEPTPAPPPPTQPPAPEPVAEPAPAPTTAAPPRELPFDPSPEDRAHPGTTGFLGTRTVPLADGTQATGPIVAGVKPGSGAEAAGIREQDVIVGFDGTLIRPTEPDPIGKFRDLLYRHAPDTEADLEVWREGVGVRTVHVLLGRQPPAFARIDTAPDWTRSSLSNGAVEDLIRDALSIDGGTATYEDTLARNRKHSMKRDLFRLREVTEAEMNLAANEALAIEVARTVADDASGAARIAAGMWRGGRRGPRGAPLPETDDVGALATAIESQLAELDAAVRRVTASWSADDREFFTSNFAKLTDRLDQGEYIYDDEDVARERTNRRLVALLAKVDREAVADLAGRVQAFLDVAVPRLVAAATAANRPGLLVGRDTPYGRIEIWGSGNDRHTNRCAFLFDLAGNDDYLDVAGRADPSRPVSIYVDATGDDLWAATSPFGLAGALCGAAAVADLAGDDQYVGRDWCEGAAAAGFALLDDRGGRDVYHAQHLSQGVGMVGAGVLADGDGADLYTGSRFCQGVGLPGGVGAVVDRAGDDRYVCTGRYDSEYGEAGLFSGWGQGVGFGFRLVASGGIGLLLDQGGDDVYEAGNFSQGGGYFYGWGILWDARGRDRYVGSRYAQGFAAHQAVGTFLEGGGDDLYQSHSGVAQGLSWDETSVVFHDMGGNDRYETGPGFSLASAAHNGMVLFLDDGGDDVYAAVPAHAGSNSYHGGHSFALFVDRAGNDTYLGTDGKETWNGRRFARDDGAYLIDR